MKSPSKKGGYHLTRLLLELKIMFKLFLMIVVVFIMINLAFADVVVVNDPNTGTLTQCIVNQGVVTCF